MSNFIQCFSAFVACIGFSLIFRIHHQLRFILVSSLGGTLGWLVFLLFDIQRYITTSDLYHPHPYHL